jgi:acetyl esterase/lipase
VVSYLEASALRTSPRILALLAVVALVAVLSACQMGIFAIANAPTLFGSYTRFTDLAYGAERRQRLDIYAPRNARHLPVVIFWHGGTWKSGDKKNYRFVGAALAAHGLVAVVADYRLYPAVHFPAFCEDGAHALAWVEAHIADYGGDPQRIVLMGHSAGAHIAAFVAYNHEFDRQAGAEPHDVVGFVGLSGPYALVPDTRELRAMFPKPYTQSDWQPVAFVDADSPPTLLLHGLKDREVTPRDSEELHDALAGNQVRVEMHLYPHAWHNDTLAPFALIARGRSPAYKDSVAFIESVTRSGPSP